MRVKDGLPEVGRPVLMRVTERDRWRKARLVVMGHTTHSYGWDLGLGEPLPAYDNDEWKEEA